METEEEVIPDVIPEVVPELEVELETDELADLQELLLTQEQRIEALESLIVELGTIRERLDQHDRDASEHESRHLRESEQRAPERATEEEKVHEETPRSTHIIYRKLFGR